MNRPEDNAENSWTWCILIIISQMTSLTPWPVISTDAEGIHQRYHTWAHFIEWLEENHEPVWVSAALKRRTIAVVIGEKMTTSWREWLLTPACVGACSKRCKHKCVECQGPRTAVGCQVSTVRLMALTCEIYEHRFLLLLHNEEVGDSKKCRNCFQDGVNCIVFIVATWVCN